MASLYSLEPYERVGMLRGSKKKYVYIQTPGKRYVKARVMLQGREKPEVTPSTSADSIIIVGRPSKKVPYGYTVVRFEDLPPELRSKLELL